MRKLIVCGLFLTLMLPACGGAVATESAGVAGQVVALEARLAALEAQVAAVTTPAAGEHNQDTAGGDYEVVVAQYLLDTAGFHGMADELKATKVVDPAFLSTVTSVRKVLVRAPWPDALHEQAGAFVELLGQLATALEADDGEAAAELAADVHIAQHELSHALDNWLGEEHGNEGG